MALPPISPRHRLLAATGVAALLVIGLVAARIGSGTENRGSEAVVAPPLALPCAPPPAAVEVVPPDEPVTAAAPLADDVQDVAPPPALASESREQEPALLPPAASAVPLAAAPAQPEPFRRVRLPGANERLAHETRDERVQRLKRERQGQPRPTLERASGAEPEHHRKKRG